MAWIPGSKKHVVTFICADVAWHVSACVLTWHKLTCVTPCQHKLWPLSAIWWCWSKPLIFNVYWHKNPSKLNHGRHTFANTLLAKMHLNRSSFYHWKITCVINGLSQDFAYDDLLHLTQIDLFCNALWCHVLFSLIERLL